MAKLPEWVLEHQTEGTQAVKIGNGYYLYKITSVWDPKKRRPKKVTEKYLGKITPEGVIKSKHEQVKENMKNITVKEFGATEFILKNNKDVIDALKMIYPHLWKEIAVFSILRLLYKSPIKNLQEDYSTSYLTETVEGAQLSPKRVSNMLREMGMLREKTKTFLQQFISGTEFAVIDLTHIFSFSENVVSATFGRNSEGEFSPQINLAFIFSLDKHAPAYFRMIPGSVRDVSSLILTVKESEIKNAVIIGDKGFYSNENIKNLESIEEAHIHYLFPIKRNSSLIDYNKIKKGDKREFDGYFMFEKRYIWHHSYRVNEKRKIVVFLDEKLKAEEERDNLARILEEDKEQLEKFFQKEHTFGTISVITDIDKNAKEIYEMLKLRMEIEVMFDAFKNVLNADRPYLGDDRKIEGWMFINFISLVFYYRIYKLLVEKSLLNTYSVKDVLLHLSRIYKLKIGNEWMNSEMPRKARSIINKLEIPIT